MDQQTEENTGHVAPDDSDWYTADELIAMRRKKKLDRRWREDMTNYNFIVGLKNYEMWMKRQHGKKPEDQEPEPDGSWLTDCKKVVQGWR